MTTSLDATVTAEVLTRHSRTPWQAQVTMDADAARVYEFTVPDGTIGLSVLPPGFAYVHMVLVHSDQPVLLTLGPTAQNQPLPLAAGGLIGFWDGEISGANVATVRYTPGTGATAHLLVYVAGESGEPPSIYTWALVYREQYEYVTTFVPWSGGSHEPITEHWETPLTSWGAPYTTNWDVSTGGIFGGAHGTDVGQVTPIVGVGSFRQYTIAGRTTDTMWLTTVTHPEQTAGGFGPASGDMELLLRLDVPTTIVAGSGSHWTGLCLGSGSSGMSIALQNIWHFFVESPVNSGAVNHWRYGYFTSQSTNRANWVMVQEGDLAIAAGTVMGLRVEYRRGTGTFPPFHHRIYFGLGTNLAELPLFLETRLQLGDRGYPGGVCSYFCEYRSNLDPSHTTAFVVNYDETHIAGYDAVRNDFWGNLWTGSTGTGETGGSGAMYVLQDQFPGAPPALAGSRSLVIRMNVEAPTTPRKQLFFHVNRFPTAFYENGRIRALWKVHQSAGGQPAYLGLYCLRRINTNADTAASVGMLVEFLQATNAYTRVLLVQWVNFATAFTILAEAPFVRPMTQLVSMELEWHRTSGQPNLTLLARLGTQTNYSDLATVLTLQIPNPYGFPARSQGPVALCYFDASPTAALDLLLDELELYRQLSP